MASEPLLARPPHSSYQTLTTDQVQAKVAISDERGFCYMYRGLCIKVYVIKKQKQKNKQKTNCTIIVQTKHYSTNMHLYIFILYPFTSKPMNCSGQFIKQLHLTADTVHLVHCISVQTLAKERQETAVETSFFLALDWLQI